MLRILPWITDGATEFIDNFITDRKNSTGKVRVFEFGSGNSTLYFLSRGCDVRSVEHDEDWACRVRETAKTFGYQSALELSCEERPYHLQFQQQHYDIVLVDGRDRMLCMQQILQVGLHPESILVFDNSERADYKYPEFKEMMDISGRDVIHFEQPQVEKANIRLTTKSYARDRADHRWITSIFYPRGMYTTQGKLFSRPLVKTVAPSANYRALNDIDRKLEKYLPFRGGFFIEAGANDGLKQSNSYYFEKELGWKGILVEAIPDLYKLCVNNRPDSECFNYALVADREEKTVSMHFVDLMSTVDGALKDEQESHIHRGLSVQNIENSYKVEVPAITFTCLLEKYAVEKNVGIPKIDFLSLDVEGYELNVLKGIDFNKIRPKYILVESKDIAAIDSLLNMHGYEQLERFSYHDYLYADCRLPHSEK